MLATCVSLVTLLDGKNVLIHFTMKLQCGIKVRMCFHVNMTARNTVYSLKIFGVLLAKEQEIIYFFIPNLCYTRRYAIVVHKVICSKAALVLLGL